ncbi:MAG: SMP-30/gluconolactonase/LRE family protein [Cyclobacteriaceae bacterium]|nr:SMP-30/gluconolactonase/LRE family protein [Cyclobacteriaceae bacterium]
MKNIVILSICLALAGCHPAHHQDIVSEGAVPEKLSGEFAFTEGPASDAEGNVFFTDQPNDRIMKWSTDGELSIWMQPAGRANGLCFDQTGDLWACADEQNELWIIDKEKNVTVLFDRYGTGKLNGPNDVWVAPDGSAYFSDPFYKRPWWPRDTTQQDGQCVYFLSSKESEPVRVIDDLVQPNGVIGTPDGKMLYVTDIKEGKTYSYAIGEQGALSNKQLFCEMGSDGMTLDERGNLYLTNAAGVTVFDASGRQIKHIKIDEPWTANVCFGGSDMKSLFITAKAGFYRLKMNVKGVGSQ